MRVIIYAEVCDKGHNINDLKVGYLIIIFNQNLNNHESRTDLYRMFS